MDKKAKIKNIIWIAILGVMTILFGILSSTQVFPTVVASEIVDTAGRYYMIYATGYLLCMLLFFMYGAVFSYKLFRSKFYGAIGYGIVAVACLILYALSFTLDGAGLFSAGVIFLDVLRIVGLVMAIAFGIICLMSVFKTFRDIRIMKAGGAQKKELTTEEDKANN